MIVTLNIPSVVYSYLELHYVDPRKAAEKAIQDWVKLQEEKEKETPYDDGSAADI